MLFAIPTKASAGMCFYSTCNYHYHYSIVCLLGTLIYSCHDPVEFIMTEYMKHKSDKDDWYSPPFYTGPGGYKMCIKVAANGQYRGAGNHVSAFVHLMKGTYDDWLVWPFRGDITIQLVNEKCDEDHVEKSVCFNESVRESSQRVMAGETAEFGPRCSQFISHLELQSTITQFLTNDCLKFRVTKIHV